MLRDCFTHGTFLSFGTRISSDLDNIVTHTVTSDVKYMHFDCCTDR